MAGFPTRRLRRPADPPGAPLSGIRATSCCIRTTSAADGTTRRVQYVENRERDVPIRLANSACPSPEASTRLRTRSATAALSRRSEFALALTMGALQQWPDAPGPLVAQVVHDLTSTADAGSRAPLAISQGVAEACGTLMPWRAS